MIYRRKIVSFTLALLVASFAVWHFLYRPVPEIDTVVSSFSGSAALINGMSIPVPLPQTASPAQVVAGHLLVYRNKARYKIVVTRKVRISRFDMVAALIDSEAGRKVLLMSYMGESHPGWWTRLYDAPAKEA